MTELYLMYDKDTVHNNDGDDSNEPYSHRGTTDTSWDFKSLLLSNTSRWNYETVHLPFDVVKGDRIHLVIAVYSTGDSFGWDRGACMEVIDGFFTAEKANKCKSIMERWEENRSGDRYDSKLAYKNELDMDIETRVPWEGYFESLDYVQVYSFTVK